MPQRRVFMGNYLFAEKTFSGINEALIWEKGVQDSLTP
jgi:hypothetical protein